MREVKCGLYKGGPFRYAHVKRDGMWITLVRQPNGPTTAWSRMPRDLTPKLSWHPTFKAFEAMAPLHTIAYCEAYVEGGDREDVKAAMRDQVSELRLECFALRCVNGQTMAEGAQLETVRDYCETQLRLPFTPFMLRRDDVDVLAERYPDSEGWVVKDGNLLNWQKVKSEVTYDLRVVGFVDGREGKTGRMVGLVGGMILADATGTEVARVGTGISMDLRQQITDDKESWLGAVVEVEAQGLGKAGGLMHPRFVRKREDKCDVDTVPQTR